MGESVYEKYFARDVIKENKWGGEGIGLAAVPQDIIPPVAKMSLGISVVRKPYLFHEPTHKHMFTEYFYFFGSNPCFLIFTSYLLYKAHNTNTILYPCGYYPND